MTDTSHELPTVAELEFNVRGDVVDEVHLRISHALIEHFSNHLYSSPNKAIEELVANGFDAFANRVRVYVPTKYTINRVIVWDDGESMDRSQLHDLWKIAESPKGKIVERIARGPRGTRAMIGKFGIGKLASYTVGRSISHLCKTEDEYLLVHVDFRQVTDPGSQTDAGTPPPATKQEVDPAATDENVESVSQPENHDGAAPAPVPMLRLSESEARALAKGLFTTVPASFDEMFDASTWTLAIISDLKREDLYAGRLSMVIGNGMPLRPDFAVWVDEEIVTPKLEKRVPLTGEWTLGHPTVVTAVGNAWDKAVQQGLTEGTLEFGETVGLNPAEPKASVPFIRFPGMGPVWGAMRLYRDPIESTRASEKGHSSGFFVFVRGRLINPTDPYVFLPEPSFRTFFRSQVVVHADGLDPILLADRERLRRETVQAREFEILQRALYLILRNHQTKLDQAEPETIGEAAADRLPLFSKEYFRDPLLALWVENEEPGSALDLGEITVERRPLSEDGPISRLSTADAEFQVNVEHPYYRALQDHYEEEPEGVRNALFREYELLAVSEQLFEGFLVELGLSPNLRREIMEWRDGQYRTMARANRESLHQLAKDVEETSFKGKKRFEKAIADILRAMGFVVEHNGAPGKEDVLLAAPVGESRYSLTFEGKSNKDAVKNDEAEIDIANAHRNEVKADHAVVVAREFAGFKQEGDPMILKQCRGQGDKDGHRKVSIMQVDALIRLAKIVRKYGYPLELLKDVFVEIESPDEKMRRIERLDVPPTEDFDFKSFLEEVWVRQSLQAKGRFVPTMSVWQSRPEWLAMEADAFKLKVIALANMAYPQIHLEKEGERVTLRQHPDVIVEYVRKLRTVRFDGIDDDEQPQENGKSGGK